MSFISLVAWNIDVSRCFDKNQVSKVCTTSTQQWMENCLHVCVCVCVSKRFYTRATRPHTFRLGVCQLWVCVCICDGQLRVCCVSSNCTHVEKLLNVFFLSPFSSPRTESSLSSCFCYEFLFFFLSLCAAPKPTNQIQYFLSSWH